MLRRRRETPDHSGDQISLDQFLESYNKNLPASFPKASASMLKKFQSAYPALFKNGDHWSLAQHRKRVIDWLSSYRSM